MGLHHFDAVLHRGHDVPAHSNMGHAGAAGISRAVKVRGCPAHDSIRVAAFMHYSEPIKSGRLMKVVNLRAAVLAQTIDSVEFRQRIAFPIVFIHVHYPRRRTVDSLRRPMLP